MSPGGPHPDPCRVGGLCPPPIPHTLAAEMAEVLRRAAPIVAPPTTVDLEEAIVAAAIGSGVHSPCVQPTGMESQAHPCQVRGQGQVHRTYRAGEGAGRVCIGGGGLKGLGQGLGWGGSGPGIGHWEQG